VKVLLSQNLATVLRNIPTSGLVLQQVQVAVPEVATGGENVVLSSDNAVRFAGAGDVLIKEVLLPDLQGSKFQL
jgi:hypothetical protein